MYLKSKLIKVQWEKGDPSCTTCFGTCAAYCADYCRATSGY